MVDFANIWTLWGALADAFSGRSSSVVSGTYPSSQWPLTAVTSSVLSGGTLTVTVDTPEGDVDCTCPGPDDTMDGFRVANEEPLFRRSVVVSFPTRAALNYNPGLVSCRSEIVAAAWPSLRIFSLTEQIGGTLRIGTSNTLIVFPTFNWIWASEDIEATVTDHGSDYWTLDSPPNNVASICGYLDLFTETLGKPVSPSDPDAQEYLASCLSYNGFTDISVAGPDINALNILADEMSSGNGAAGTLQTHRSKKVLVRASTSVALPRATGTSDNMMHRIAQAVRAWIGGGLVVYIDKSPRAAVAVNAAIFRKVQ